MRPAHTGGKASDDPCAEGKRDALARSSAQDTWDSGTLCANSAQEHFEALIPFGYENDGGGFGDVVLDVGARKITVERNDRYEDYTTSSYEV